MSLVRQILYLSIPCKTQLSKEESLKLMQSYELARQALESFVQGELTLDEYLELLELHQVNVDSYLDIVEENLETIGVL